ncbi:MAG: aldehyde dehydrogenase, partial [Polyangiaceae bacterium]
MRAIDPALYAASKKISEGTTAAVVEKWSGAKLADVVLADAALADEATKAAVLAFEKLRASSSYLRKRLVFEVARAIEADA